MNKFIGVEIDYDALAKKQQEKDKSTKDKIAQLEKTMKEYEEKQRKSK